MRPVRRIGACLLLAIVAPACVKQSLPEGSTHGPTTSEASRRVADVVVDPAARSSAFDRRLLGSNLPAWIGPDRLADPRFQEMTRRSGVSLLRMPGGSWSNSYDWLACEQKDPAGCHFPFGARPTDFADFMLATGVAGMWTVSINMSAGSAAAAVAFFNGAVDDERPIGVDRYGVDWKTVGSWAALRARGGNPEPVPITLWEVGNEVYGGRADAGREQCGEFGWEDVWTCDGTEYVLGDEAHDGFLAIRKAMVMVDPTIEVGAVGVGDPDGWSNWGNEVIDAAGSALDFYSLHEYGFDESPSPDDALRRPKELWPPVIDAVRAELDAHVAIAVTEHNMVGMESGDADHSMTTALNALYLADTIGQLATEGVEIANQWNLANGTTESGTDYGLISLENGEFFPAAEAMSMWSQVGEEILPASFEDNRLRVYPTRHVDGRLTVLILNLTGDELTRTIGVPGSVDLPGRLDSVFADGPLATQMTSKASDVSASQDLFTVALPPWSINSLQIAKQ